MRSTLLAVVIGFSCFCCARKDFFADTPLKDEHALAGTLTYPDSVTVQAGKHYAHGSLYSFLFGKHYRDVWAAPVQVRVLDIRKEKGGLKITKVGGSMQSTSLTLRDKQGIEYALRTVDKDPSGSLHPFLKATFISNFLRDQTSALNPYAALIVAPLALAAEIPHAKPELVYVPADSALLGKYTKVAGNRLFMLEEKLEHKGVLLEDHASVTDVVSTKKLLKKRFSKSRHHVDQLAFAKARLFDIFINDRDRHEGQWNWSEHKQDKTTLYKPIPKDRDQALYKFADGMLPRLIGRGLNYQKFISFRQDFDDLEALTYKSEYIDQLFLSEVTQEQFDSLAIDLKASLTDAVIEKAVQVLPVSVFSQIGESTTEALKKRRDLLPAAAKTFYTLLAKEVSVVGTDDAELFRVNRINDELTEVAVLDAESKNVLYQRTFKREETNVLELFGLGNADVFEIKGDVKKGINIIVYAASGEDEVIDTSNLKKGPRIVIRRTKAAKGYKPDAKTKQMLENTTTSPDFDRKGSN